MAAHGQIWQETHPFPIAPVLPLYQSGDEMRLRQALIGCLRQDSGNQGFSCRGITSAFAFALIYSKRDRNLFVLVPPRAGIPNAMYGFPSSQLTLRYGPALESSGV